VGLSLADLRLACGRSHDHHHRRDSDGQPRGEHASWRAESGSQSGKNRLTTTYPRADQGPKVRARRGDGQVSQLAVEGLFLGQQFPARGAFGQMLLDLFPLKGTQLVAAEIQQLRLYPVAVHCLAIHFPYPNRLLAASAWL